MQRFLKHARTAARTYADCSDVHIPTLFAGLLLIVAIATLLGLRYPF